MTYREVSKKLIALGCQELPRKGGRSHRKWLNPMTEQATSLPDWGGKDLKLGTVRAAVHKLGLDWKSFKEA